MHELRENILWNGKLNWKARVIVVFEMNIDMKSLFDIFLLQKLWTKEEIKWIKFFSFYANRI